MAPFNISSSPLVKCVNMESKSMDVKGLLFDTNPIDYIVRLFPLQLALVVFLQAAFNYLLKPLGTVPAVAQILGGILIGPTFLSRYEHFEKIIFPDIKTGGDSMFLPATLGIWGLSLYIFLVGVKLDVCILMRSSKRERALGIFTVIIPMLFVQPLGFLLVTKDREDLTKLNLPMVTGILSTTSFHTVISFLSDLKILNTELGRLATSASAISGLFSMFKLYVVFSIRQLESSTWKVWVLFIFTSLASLLFITVVLRKVLIWMMRLIPQSEAMKEIYVVVVFFMIFGTTFLGEWFGTHCLWGPAILGLVLPVGSSISSTLVDKLDPFVSGLLLPLYFCMLGTTVNLGKVEAIEWVGVLSFHLLAFLGKFIGTIIPCAYYRIPFRDACTLGLILSTLGTYDVQVYGAAIPYVGFSIFSVMVICAPLIAAMTSLLVRFLYNPSRRYIVYKNHNIQNIKPNAEVRILVCIYNEENVPTVINILEASNPTRESPICVYLLHLIELQNGSAPLLISHRGHEKMFDEPTPSDHIVNGFKIYEKQNQGCLYVHPFTTFTHFFSAHDDICTIAINKRTSIMIIPFHKQWNIDGTTQTCKWINANKKVLKHAPCSVGILIDRGVLNGARSILSGLSNYKVCVIFLGDPDDREALCLAMRMLENPNVSLTVHRMMLVNSQRSVTEKMLDGNVINEYILNSRNYERHMYKEEEVKDGVDIINVMRTMENQYDLILVGRSHDSYSRFFYGVSEWSEYPELGFFGDMFASSDFKGNSTILVLQQHSCIQENVVSNDLSQSQTETFS